MDISRLKRAVTDADVPWVGVAIRRNLPDTSRHTGIIYRAAAGELRMADMAWHEVFRDQAYNPAWDYYCAVPHFEDPIIEESFADYCAHVSASASQRQPPYNLLAANPALFDQSGRWVSTDPDVGLNCSSFVVSVFHSYNVPLVRIGTWPVGLPKDIQEQTTLVYKMMHSGRPQDHAQSLKIALQIGKHPRIRPEETAGACLEDEKDRPVDGARGAANGLLVLKEWDDHHP